MSNVIKLKRLHWASHIQNMDEKLIPKRILQSNIVRMGPAGIPKKRWVNAVEIARF
jgi:hypothetical protein